MCLCYVSNADSKPYIGSMNVHDVICCYIVKHILLLFLFIISFQDVENKRCVFFRSLLFIRKHHGANPHTKFRTHNRINTHISYNISNLHSNPPPLKTPKRFHAWDQIPENALFFFSPSFCFQAVNVVVVVELEEYSTWLFDNFIWNSKQL